MKEQRRDTFIFVGAVALLLGAALAIKRYTAAPSQVAINNTYLGHYGYVVTLTPETASRLQMFGAFTNKEKTAEVLFVFPRAMKDDEPFSIPETKYRENQLLRMEVNPNKNFPEGTDVIAAAKYAVTTTLKGKNEPFTISDIGRPMPGFVVDITAPTPIRQVFLKGALVHYLLTADPDNPALLEVINGLAEVHPTDEPGK